MTSVCGCDSERSKGESCDMWSKKYFHYVEKETHRVSSVWKVLHVSIFLLIAINSLLSAYGSSTMSKTFKQRCILHARPNLKLREVTTKRDIIQNRTTTDSISLNNVSVTDANITLSEEHQATVFDLSEAEEVPGKNETFIFDGMFWFYNATQSGKIAMEFSGSVFGKTATCDFALFVPLSSLVIAAVLGVIALLCGKGGRGYTSDVLPGSWSFVYPVIVTSTLMTLLSIIAAVMVTEGLESFCSNFEPYTGQTRCTSSMDYFLLGNDNTLEGFWKNYAICKHSYIFGILLWASQLSVTVLRLLRVADFQFSLINVEKMGEEIEDEKRSQKIHQAVVKSFPGMKVATELTEEDPEEIVADANGEAGTQL